MKCEVLSREGGTVTFRMIFGPDVFEAKIIEAYRRICPEDIENPALALLSTAALLGRNKDAVAIVREAIQSILDENRESAMRELGIFSEYAIDVKPVAGELGEPLVLVARVSSLSAETLKYEGLVASYNEVVVTESEVEDRLARDRARYGAASDEELLDKAQTHGSVEEMRDDIDRSLRRLAERLNVSAKRNAVAKALIEANPMAIPESEIERYIDGEIQKLIDQMGEESFRSQGFETDALRAAVRRDVGHMPHLNRILSALVSIADVEVTDDDRRREIESARAQSVRPDSLESVDETLKALHENPSMLGAIDRKISLDKTLDFVVEKSALKVRAGLTLQEAVPQYFA